jgi:uncharacterized protein (DUF433 family)
MNYKDRITIDPRIRSGKPCIRGTRIAVADVFDYLGGGMTVEEILDDFPDLTAEDIQACFAFAADRERRLAVIPYEAVVRQLLEAAGRKIPPQKMRLISPELKR